MKLKMLLCAAFAAAVCAMPVYHLIAEDQAPKAEAPAAEAEGEAVEAAANEEGFIDIFNGKDLTGWRGRQDLWKVEEGAITGDAKEDPGYNTFLIYDEELGDFELRFKYRIFSGNSGVQYRSKVLNEEKFQVGGYQADFEAGDTYSGILYDEGGVAGGRGIMAARGEKVHFKPDGSVEKGALEMSSEELQKSINPPGEWNEYVIIAKGNHLIHKINGNTTIEVIDESDKALKSGVLALQLHGGGPMKVQWKDLKLKKLDGEAK